MAALESTQALYELSISSRCLINKCPILPCVQCELPMFTPNPPRLNPSLGDNYILPITSGQHLGAMLSRSSPLTSMSIPPSFTPRRCPFLNMVIPAACPEPGAQERPQHPHSPLPTPFYLQHSGQADPSQSGVEPSSSSGRAS